MKALILAAGFGNRMRPLTDHKHKTLLEVDGRAIIDRIVSGLIENGVHRIVVVTGYRSEELVDHLRKHFKKVAFEFVHNPRYRETNNIYSMALAFEQMTIDEDILLIESDLEDPRYFSEAQLRNRVDAFFESLEHKKLMAKA